MLLKSWIFYPKIPLLKHHGKAMEFGFSDSITKLPFVLSVTVATWVPEKLNSDGEQV